MFLKPQAVCVVVCNAGEFERRSSGGIDQLEDDIAKLCDLRACDWLRSISYRVPDSSALLVVTKCNLVAERAPHLGQRMETACRKWLASWVKAGIKPVLLETGVRLTSCCLQPQTPAPKKETWARKLWGKHGSATGDGTKTQTKSRPAACFADSYERAIRLAFEELKWCFREAGMPPSRCFKLSSTAGNLNVGCLPSFFSSVVFIRCCDTIVPDKCFIQLAFAQDPWISPLMYISQRSCGSRAPKLSSS